MNHSGLLYIHTYIGYNAQDPKINMEGGGGESQSFSFEEKPSTTALRLDLGTSSSPFRKLRLRAPRALELNRGIPSIDSCAKKVLGKLV
jgi:hypothetical protein